MLIFEMWVCMQKRQWSFKSESKHTWRTKQEKSVLMYCNYIEVYWGPPPPSGTVQLINCWGVLIEQHLQCTQFWALIIRSLLPSALGSEYSYTPAGQNLCSGPSNLVIETSTKHRMSKVNQMKMDDNFHLGPTNLWGHEHTRAWRASARARQSREKYLNTYKTCHAQNKDK